jgi:sideroflexin-5
MLFISSSGLESAKKLILSYKNGEAKEMTSDLWRAKQIVDSTLHPGTSPEYKILLYMNSG